MTHSLMATAPDLAPTSTLAAILFSLLVLAVFGALWKVLLDLGDLKKSQRKSELLLREIAAAYLKKSDQEKQS